MVGYLQESRGKKGKKSLQSLTDGRLKKIMNMSCTDTSSCIRVRATFHPGYGASDGFPPYM